MHDPPHMAALTSQNPFDAQTFRFRVDLCVEPFDHLMGIEQSEVAALGSVGAPGVVQPEFMEEHQVAHQVKVPGSAK